MSDKLKHYSFVVEGFRDCVRWPGAKAIVRTAGWNDPCTEFAVQFRNGVEIAHHGVAVTLKQADAYYRSTLKLTGVAP